MIDYAHIEEQLVSGIGLEHRPVAVSFLELRRRLSRSSKVCGRPAAASGSSPPKDAPSTRCPPITSTVRLARTRTTFRCPSRARELDDTLGFMTSIGYLRMEEVPPIPRLAETPGVVLYAPLGQTPVDPDVVLLWGPPGRVMVLQEAAIRAGVTTQLATLARPTCMILPAALSHGTVASTACIGNRVYTDLDEADLYVAVPGRDLPRVAEETAVVRSANATLFDYHQARKRELVGGEGRESNPPRP